MIKVNISTENEKQIIEVGGSIPEIAGDIAVLLSRIYNQFRAASPAAAELFRQGVQKMVGDDNGPCWNNRDDQIGIALRMPGKGE